MYSGAIRWFTLGLILSIKLTGFGSLAAASSRKEAVVVVYVHDYAEVPKPTLIDAEKIASGIFEKAGVSAVFDNAPADQPPTQEASLGEYRQARELSEFHLYLYSRTRSEEFQVPRTALGLAPGAGPDRQTVYVFYDRVQHVFERQLRPTNDAIYANRAQILGHAMAHELGHVILNISVHAPQGIMRGEWSEKDLRDAGQGYLLFTPGQAEVLRAEARRRSGRTVQGD